jgi:DNA-binding NarL/FixJ family response regulator
VETNSVSIERLPKVLLVDNYQPLLIAWRRFLGSWCEVVGTVSSGRAALEVARECRPDVIVLDLNMPELSGLDVCRAIQQTMPQVGVVLVSAADGAELRRTAFEVGAAAFVPKYWAGCELESAIRRACREQPSFQSSTTGENERD